MYITRLFQRINEKVFSVYKYPIFTVVLIVILNFSLGFVWKIISYQKIKNLEPYEEIVLKFGFK